MPRSRQEQLGLSDTRAGQGIRVEFSVPLGIPEVTHPAERPLASAEPTLAPQNTGLHGIFEFPWC